MKSLVCKIQITPPLLRRGLARRVLSSTQGAEFAPELVQVLRRQQLGLDTGKDSRLGDHAHDSQVILACVLPTVDMAGADVVPLVADDKVRATEAAFEQAGQQILGQPSRPGGAMQGFPNLRGLGLPALTLGDSTAVARLILDGGFALLVGGIAGVQDRADHGICITLWRPSPAIRGHAPARTPTRSP